MRLIGNLESLNPQVNYIVNETWVNKKHDRRSYDGSNKGKENFFQFSWNALRARFVNHVDWYDNEPG